MKSLPLFGLLALLFSVFPADAVIAADPVAAKPTYPLTTCVVSGDQLGEMGKPVVIIYQGTEVQFCCKECVAGFQKDPAKYLAKRKATQPKS